MDKTYTQTVHTIITYGDEICKLSENKTNLDLWYSSMTLNCPGWLLCCACYLQDEYFCYTVYVYVYVSTRHTRVGNLSNEDCPDTLQMGTSLCEDRMVFCCAFQHNNFMLFLPFLNNFYRWAYRTILALFVVKTYGYQVNWKYMRCILHIVY